jgi:hypothetical protein
VQVVFVHDSVNVIDQALQNLSVAFLLEGRAQIHGSMDKVDYIRMILADYIIDNEDDSIVYSRF